MIIILKLGIFLRFREFDLGTIIILFLRMVFYLILGKLFVMFFINRYLFNIG